MSGARNRIAFGKRRAMLFPLKVYLLSCLLLAPLLAGCGDSNPEPLLQSQAPSVPAYAQVLSPRIEMLRQELLAPGAVVVIRSGELGNWSSAFGYRDLAKSSAIEVSDFVRIGSNTKTMTATAILQMVDEGRLSLDDPVGKFVPGVPNAGTATIRDLLLMRSGIPTYSNTVLMNEQLDNNPLRVWLPPELVAISEGDVVPPDTEYFYSNTNYVLLGMIIEQLSGRSAEAEFESRLFAPRGLTHSLLPALTSNAVPAVHPRGYQFGTNVSTIPSQALPPAEREAAYAGTLLPHDVTDENPSWAWTAGSGISTADDLADYVKLMVGGGYLSPSLQSQRLRTIPVNPAKPEGTAYGLGVAYFGVGELYGHTGELPGFQSFMAYDPGRDLTIIVWTNLNNAPDGRPPASTIGHAITEYFYKEIPETVNGVGDEP